METMSPLADRTARMRFNRAMREKGVEAKACGRCFAVKGYGGFSVQSSSASGRMTICKRCTSERRHQWNASNAEGRKEYNRRWRKGHPARAAQHDRGRSQSPERQEYNRRWRESNQERRKAHLIKSRILYRARKAAATVVPFTVDEMLADWEEYDLYGCAFCGGPYEEIEHLMPLSRGGEHSLANIVPSCIECNRGVGGKHDRNPYEWLAERFPNLAPLLLPVDEG
ncbi:HNH endonuclease [Streptomyces sp. NBC_00464]|uniref:HNH endonuclease n=1 Tax=Streptomyces sp. NBC_00464 TaxID=2975751 RepID=UPI002E193EF2